ncbi:NAD-dependent epimerase/dehydratase family protein [Streptomyces sp. TS71-3]|uniref:NAD-dependent epimerase/dehydratase family protein n=1 Tax=Streptomyces sp. TS71-3 TaxID=2733862 RepID=UPI001BB37309|nr:NAD-dependent epimerase/dehydratase family protein [Streptomyces sp. TS71-3]
MRILVLGGTRFIGRHLVSAALERGHEVTLFNRGRSSTGLFPDVPRLVGDRDTDLDALRQGHWDATVDLSGYEPQQVRAVGEALGARAGRYVLFSSTAVYAPPQGYGFQEDAAVVRAADPAGAGADYGELKALCETAAAEVFGNPLVVRPTYVVGPYDYTGRFTYWVERIAAGGEVLAPGPREAFFQLIDVRDLTAWLVTMIERRAAGTYQAAHPFPPVAFVGLLETIAAAVAPPDTTLTWVDQEFAEACGMDGEALPLWPGANPPGVVEAADASRAVAAGLRPRPLEETVRDLLDHERREPTPRDPGAGITRAVEADVLARWHARAVGEDGARVSQG